MKNPLPILPEDVCAVVVTYHPDGDLPVRLKKIALQVSHVIIVDNRSATPVRACLESLRQQYKFDLILNDLNLGLATALNQGLQAARSAGYRWALTLDQDSLPAPCMVQLQLDTLNNSELDTVLCVSPNIYSAGARDVRPWGWLGQQEHSRLRFRIIREEQHDLQDVTITITSGALMNLVACERVGPFRDDYFIDYVDTEYCLRARQLGYRILVSGKARLDHRLGNAKEFRLFGRWITPTFHSPLRRYYIQRNRIPTILSFGFKYPHWLFFDILVNSLHHVLIILYEDQKVAKISASFIGAWHGLRGRLGPK